MTALSSLDFLIRSFSLSHSNMLDWVVFCAVHMQIDVFCFCVRVCVLHNYKDTKINMAATANEQSNYKLNFSLIQRSANTNRDTYKRKYTIGSPYAETTFEHMCLCVRELSVSFSSRESERANHQSNWAYYEFVFYFIFCWLCSRFAPFSLLYTQRCESILITVQYSVLSFQFRSAVCLNGRRREEKNEEKFMCVKFNCFSFSSFVFDLVSFSS